MSKVVIVTGASRGIGLAIVDHLLRHSHKVVLVARSAGPLGALKLKFPAQVAVATTDATDYEALGGVVDLAVSTFGRLDSVIINHGMLEPIQRLADADLDAWKRIYDVNVFSALALAKAAIPQLRASNGRIILTSSGAGLRGYSSWGAYGSSKAAANSLIQHLAVEEPNITSVAVAPGRVDTDMQKQIREQGGSSMDPAVYANFVQAFEGGTLHPPEKPAEVIAKLSLDATSDLSGKYVNWDDAGMEAYHWK